MLAEAKTLTKLTYYEVLDVSKDAGPPAIKKAFRALSLTLHPDKARSPPPSAPGSEREIHRF